MAMAAPILTTIPTAIMTTSAQILTLTQWLSPAYPIGAFAYSHGLEQAVADGHVRDAQSLHIWLSDILSQGAGQTDATLIAAAHESPDQAERIDQTARAFAPCAERLTEADRQGAAFCRTTSTLWPGPDTKLTFPVALGAAAARQNLPLDLTITLYLQSFASNLIAAAQRLMPLGQTEAQGLLRDLAPSFDAIARTATPDLNNLHSQSFLSDITAMRHETLEPRIFAT